MRAPHGLARRCREKRKKGLARVSFSEVLSLKTRGGEMTEEGGTGHAGSGDGGKKVRCELSSKPTRKGEIKAKAFSIEDSGGPEVLHQERKHKREEGKEGLEADARKSSSCPVECQQQVGKVDAKCYDRGINNQQ